MAIDERRIQSIVAEVLDRLESGRPGDASAPAGEPLGAHEDLEPMAWTGDHGLTLLERAPYGPIAVITPVTNPSETIINNGISMISGGNTVVLCPHPNARRVSILTVDLMNRAAKRAGASMPLLHTVAQPTLEVAQGLLRDRRIRLNAVTGG